MLQKNHIMWVARLLLTVALLLVAEVDGGLTLLAQQEMDRVPEKIGRQIRAIDSRILAAGTMFKKQDYTGSAELISRAQQSMVKMVRSADAKTVNAAKLTYRKLAKAHQLLSEKGQVLAPLEPLGNLAQSTPAKNPVGNPTSEQKISFVGQIAPVLIDKCGSCHVNERRGNFSTASFKNLDNSTMVTFGMADDSRLVEVIESGEMPPGKRKVTVAELKAIKQWINQGAAFDGENPTDRLVDLAKPLAAGDFNANAGTPAKPNGQETVSFGLHVAPILMEHCARCHIARNPQGNFSMANFAAMMRGGNGGQKPLAPGNGAGSEIVLRMKGENRDVMPPTGKLDDRLIALVEHWINEGARFDPNDTRLAMRAVAAKGLARSMDHDRLTDYRRKASQETWQLALSGVTPEIASTKNFLMIGTGSQERLERVGRVAESIAGRVVKVLGSPQGKPFVKGDITVFVVDKRYDFSEFGRMVDKKAFDPSAISRWRSDTVTARVALLSRFRDQVEDYEIPLARDIASVHVANWDASVPRWFADGMGYWAAEKMFRRDGIVQQWQSAAVAAAGGMTKADDFLTGNMADGQAALASYRFVQLLDGRGRALKRLVHRLAQGRDFESSFVDVFGATAEKLVQQQW
jgi:mono/diheme cytochrome c family protein